MCLCAMSMERSDQNIGLPMFCSTHTATEIKPDLKNKRITALKALKPLCSLSSERNVTVFEEGTLELSKLQTLEMQCRVLSR